MKLPSGDDHPCLTVFGYSYTMHILHCAKPAKAGFFVIINSDSEDNSPFPDEQNRRIKALILLCYT